jgi:putative intracellular protease/amidase
MHAGGRWHHSCTFASMHITLRGDHRARTDPVVSDVSIDQIDAGGIDILIIPGGWAPDYWRRDERFKKVRGAAHCFHPCIRST